MKISALSQNPADRRRASFQQQQLLPGQVSAGLAGVAPSGSRAQAALGPAPSRLSQGSGLVTQGSLQLGSTVSSSFQAKQGPTQPVAGPAAGSVPQGSGLVPQGSLQPASAVSGSFLARQATAKTAFSPSASILSRGPGLVKQGSLQPLLGAVGGVGSGSGTLKGQGSVQAEAQRRPSLLGGQGSVQPDGQTRPSLLSGPPATESQLSKQATFLSGAPGELSRRYSTVGASSTVVDIRADALSGAGEVPGLLTRNGDAREATASGSPDADADGNEAEPTAPAEEGSAPLTYDPTFHGPASADRSVQHDMPAGLLLMGLWVLLLFLMVLSFVFGRPAWLAHPLNTAGLLCGDSGAQSTLPYLWWPTTDKGQGYCVGACPVKDAIYCVDTSTYLQASGGGCTPMPSLFDTVPLFGRCMPSRAAVAGGDAGAAAAWKAHVSQVDSSRVLVQASLADAWRGWWIVLVCLLVTVGLSHVLMTFLSTDPAIYVPLSAVGGVAMPALMGVLILILGGPLQGVAGGSKEYLGSLTNRRLSSVWWLASLAGVAGIAFLVLAGLLALHCMASLARGRVQTGVRLLGYAGQVVREVPLLLYLPQLTCVALCLLGIYAYVVGVFMFSMQLRLRGLHHSQYYGLQLMWLLTPLHALGVLWMAAFILASTRVTTAVVIATWYWTREPRADKLEVLVVPIAVHQNLTCHPGSIALAALAVTLAAPAQAVTRMLPSTSSMPPASRAALLHLSSDAYVQIAVHGTSLMQSAQAAAHLLHRQRKRMDVCTAAAATVTLPGKVFTTVFSMLLAYWLQKYVASLFSSPLTPVGVVAISGIACAAISTAYCIVHEQAVETLLQCFCEDCERNDGSAMHPYYMPTAFKNIVLRAAAHRAKQDDEDPAQPSKSSQVVPVNDTLDEPASNEQVNAPDEQQQQQVLPASPRPAESAAPASALPSARSATAAEDKQPLLPAQPSSSGEPEPPAQDAITAPKATFEDTPLAGFYGTPKPVPGPKPAPEETFGDTPLAGFYSKRKPKPPKPAPHNEKAKAAFADTPMAGFLD